MTRLAQIESFIKPCAEVISSIIRAEVTVVDEELNRIYGTGFYQSEEIPAIAKKKSSAFFGSILREGTPKLVTDICNDAVCKECERHDLCTIKAEMGYPLEEQGEIIGIIGISAFEEKAGEYIKENYDRLLEFLTEHQLPAELSGPLYRAYGDVALEVVRTNPYVLSSWEFGVEFSQADALALSLGIAADDPQRLEAGLLFELSHNNWNNGHTFLPAQKLISATGQLLEAYPKFETLSESCIAPDSLIREFIGGGIYGQ